MQTENRYSRQLRRYAFALRLIRHNARTQTILAWTGLSTYRIRTLYRANGADQGDAGRRRLRGRAPYQLQFFWRTPKRAIEAATLGGIARLLDVIPAHPVHDAPEPLNSLQRGEAVCAAYELFHAYIPTSQVSIEHAFLLVSALSRGDEVRLGHCVACDGLILVDCLKPPRQTCAFCSSARKEAL
jgi:Flagellar transcriptional activator (FlhC)